MPSVTPETWKPVVSVWGSASVIFTSFQSGAETQSPEPNLLLQTSFMHFHLTSQRFQQFCRLLIYTLGTLSMWVVGLPQSRGHGICREASSPSHQKPGSGAFWDRAFGVGLGGAGTPSTWETLPTCPCLLPPLRRWGLRESEGTPF